MSGRFREIQRELIPVKFIGEAKGGFDAAARGEYTHLEIRILYDRGERLDERGFYAVFQPIVRDDHGVSYCPSDGVRVTITHCERYSVKNEKEALAVLAPHKERYAKYVCDKNRLQVVEEE